MNPSSINIKSENLFPIQFQLFGWVLLVLGIAIFFNYPFVSPFLILGALCIFTGFSGIEFSRTTNQYRTYNSLLFMKFGKWGDYDSIDTIYINAVNVSQKIITRITEGSTIRNKEYHAYLQFGNGTKEFISHSKDKEKLLEKIAPLAEFSGIDISENAEKG